MASSRIKGITIEIGGDTTKLNKALKDVDSSLKGTQNQLRDVNKLLKLDPTNTELLKQKQDALGKAITDTYDRLKVLKDALKEMQNAPDSDKTIDQQNALKREIIETEQSLKSLTKEYENFGSVAKQQLKAVGDKMKDVGGKLTDTGKTLSATLTAPIVALGTVGVNYNAQMEQYRVMLTTLTGSAEEADRVISQLQEDARKSPFDTQTFIEANQYLISAGVNADEARTMIQNLGNAVSATGGGTDELNRMAQNLQQIKNVGKATQQDIKQFANAGINIYGLLADATGKTVEEVKEMDVSYEALADAFAKANQEGGMYYGAMEAQSQTLNGSLSNTKESIQVLLGSIMESAMPIIVEVLQKIQDVIEWLNGLDEETKRTILIVASIVAVLGPALMIIGQIITGIGGLISVIGALLNPVGIVIAVIGAVIAWMIKLYNTNEDFRNKVNEVASTVKEKFTSIKDTIVDTIGKARDFVHNAIEKIKSFFKFEWSLPKLKLPHISISGGFSLVPPRVPHFSIDWYSKAMKNGMILNNPTIFGAMNGKLLGAGEAGSETIVGTQSLMSMISKAVGSNAPVINMTINATDQNVYQLADLVSDRITQKLSRERMVY